MTSTKLSLEPFSTDKKTTYVVGHYEGAALSKQLKELDKELDGQLASADCSGEKGQVLVRTAKGCSVVVVGLGKKKGQNIRATLDVVANTLKSLRSQRHKKVSIVADTFFSKNAIHWTVQATQLGLHQFTKYKEKSKDKIKHIDTVTVLAKVNKQAQKEFDDSLIVASAITQTRDLVNTPPNVAHPDEMEKIARSVAKKNNLKLTVLSYAELKKKKMGCICAVGQGSNHPPRMIILEYQGGRKKDKPVAMVGKGITFDTGGYNLKTSPHIGTMKLDKAGSVSVLYAIEAAAKLKLKVNVIAALGVAENKVSSTAYLPDDILHAYNGTTVEIGNTDAEGRLVLADTLSYVSEMNPKAMVDVATLTGASIIALGWFTIATMGTDQKVVNRLVKAGASSEEKIWQLPLFDEMDELIKSPVADINNINEGVNAGCIVGGVFLKNFVGDTPWAHMDIGGASWTKSEKGIEQKGSTGATVRLLIEFLKGFR